MFFKGFFQGIADTIDARFKSYDLPNQNPADKGELCEIFISDFLEESLGDNFRIFRGGRIIDHEGNSSKQVDVILTNKRSMKVFSNKGVYPTEIVQGIVSITATLSLNKLKDCIAEFDSIPKENFNFSMKSAYPEEFFHKSVDIWRTLIPYKCVFAFKGEIKADWISVIEDYDYQNPIQINSMPDLIIVNKVGIIEKDIYKDSEGQVKARFGFVSFKISNKSIMLLW